MAWDYTNDVSGLLSTAYTAGGTSLNFTLSSGSLPATGRLFILKIDGEYFLCTAWTVSSGTYTATVVGAQDSSTAANHASGAGITGCWVTPSMLDGIRANICQVGLYANLPTSGMKQGDQYKCLDSSYEFVYTGSRWQAFFMGAPVTIPPSLSSLTWVNQGSATATQTRGVIYLDSVVGSGGVNTNLLVKAAAYSPPYTFSIGLIPDFPWASYLNNALSVRNSSSGKFISMRYVSGGGAPGVGFVTMNSPTSENTYPTPTASIAGIPPAIFLKFQDDGTNQIFFLSRDLGNTWFQALSQSRTSFVVTDQVGFSVEVAYNGGNPSKCSLFHFAEFSGLV